MKCSKCPVETGVSATVMCPDCHRREVERIHAHDTPDIPEVPLLHPPYCPPYHLATRPNASGRRVFKKEKGLQ